MKLKNTPLALALLAGLAGTAFAADMLDADGDGQITKAEVMAAHPDVTDDAFMQIDADGDGMVSEEELTAAREAALLPADG